MKAFKLLIGGLLIGAVFMVSTAFAASQVLVYVGSFGQYTSSAFPSGSVSLGSSCSYSWGNSLAYDFTYASPAPQKLSFNYVDFYGGNATGSYGSLIFAPGYLYAWDGSDTRTLPGYANNSFFTYDITNYISPSAVNFPYAASGSNRSVVWEVTVNDWDSGGPIYACGFNPQVVWYN